MPKTNGSHLPAIREPENPTGSTSVADKSETLKWQKSEVIALFISAIMTGIMAICTLAMAIFTYQLAVSTEDLAIESCKLNKSNAVLQEAFIGLINKTEQLEIFTGKVVITSLKNKNPRQTSINFNEDNYFSASEVEVDQLHCTIKNTTNNKVKSQALIYLDDELINVKGNVEFNLTGNEEGKVITIRLGPKPSDIDSTRSRYRIQFVNKTL